MTFTCADCKHYRADGWPAWKTQGGAVIHDGPCRQYGFYNHDAARRFCKGQLKVVTQPEGKE